MPGIMLSRRQIDDIIAYLKTVPPVDQEWGPKQFTLMGYVLTGVGAFDVFVSINGGPFTRWLENTRSRSGLYPGAAGRSYAFYSRARDLAGELTRRLHERGDTVAGIRAEPEAIARLASRTPASGPNAKRARTHARRTSEMGSRESSAASAPRLSAGTSPRRR